MKRNPGLRTGALAMVFLVLAAASPARAVPPGVAIEFDGQGEGKVTFTGARHSGKAMHCSVCHLEIFDLSRSSQITRADHRRRNFCFVCHDGRTAFAARGQCERCHVEPAPGSDSASAVALTQPAPN